MNGVDQCDKCLVWGVTGVNAICPLPVCLSVAFDEAPGKAMVETIALWELGMTTDQVAKARGLKTMANTWTWVADWREKKRKLGLLI